MPSIGKLFPCLVAALLAVFSAGCGPNPTRAVKKDRSGKALPAAQPGSVRTLVDGTGRVVTITRSPKRIISIAPGATEILYAIGCGERLVGVDKYSEYPEAVKAKPCVGSGFRLNIEVVLALAPDLLITWWFHEEAIKALEKKGLSVVAIHPDSVDRVMETIRMLGLITGHLKEAERLVSDMQVRLDKVAARVKEIPEKGRPLVYYELTEQMKSAGPGTFTNELISMAGGINLAAGEPLRYPILSREYIVARNPEVIVIISRGSSVEEVKKRGGWGGIKAVKVGRVYTIDSNLVTSNPRIVQGLETFARWFHPERFK